MSKRYRKLPVGTEIECQWCNNIHKADEWDKYSLEQCSNRQMRRDFKHLEDTSIFDKKTNVYYRCPSCNQWSGGWQLMVANTEDKELLKLGGEPITSIKSPNDTTK